MEDEAAAKATDDDDDDKKKFINILNEFLNNLIEVFPELELKLDESLNNIRLCKETKTDIDSIKEYIKKISKGIWGKSLIELAVTREKIIKSLSSYSDKKEIMGRVVKQKLKVNEISKTLTGTVF